MKPGETEQQLNLAGEDGLVVHYSAVATKGSNVGHEQDGYRISPDEEDEEASGIGVSICSHLLKYTSYVHRTL